MNAKISSEMVTQKQSEINLIRKIFEEIFKCIGNESSVYEPQSDQVELEPFGSVGCLTTRTHFVVPLGHLFQNDNKGLPKQKLRASVRTHSGLPQVVRARLLHSHAQVVPHFEFGLRLGHSNQVNVEFGPENRARLDLPDPPVQRGAHLLFRSVQVQKITFLRGVASETFADAHLP